MLLFLILVTIVCSCAPKQKVYYFDCNKQDPEVIYNFFGQAINMQDYYVTKFSKKDSIIFVATRQLIQTNKIKGIEKESIELHFYFVFNNDKKKSEIKLYYIVEMNGKRKIKKLTNDQLEKYEKDVNILQEKLLFYCNPDFKGR
ncbi:MAG: hypothetical protein FWG85_05090 [Bacteroidetes bacterium]|nr:hypothetical protein [Bacteroidota bacterium]